jgi:transcriptional regulator GlxA family with amidase domain
MDWSISIPTLDSHHPTLRKVTHYVLQNLNSFLTLEDLARAAQVTTFYLCRLFKEQLNLSPMKWLWMRRTWAAGAYVVSKKEFCLTDIAFACGFSSSAHFSRLFKQIYGVTPSKFRKEHCSDALQSAFSSCYRTLENRLLNMRYTEFNCFTQ